MGVGASSILAACGGGGGGGSSVPICGGGGSSGNLNSYFDATIQGWYATWQNTPLVTNDLSTGVHSGLVQNGVLNFYSGATPSGPAAFLSTTSGNAPIP
ncbi:hypothetical protein THIX_20653 [Thiomonas sp. X19]|nr:hypothetical protein THIX_20653 [Thiomonas sp. X19]